MMKLLEKLQNYIHLRKHIATDDSWPYEFCTRCNANLALQKGFNSALPYWVCKGCGEMLINPALDTDSDIVWVCDECGAILNVQSGFREKEPEWRCEECGFINQLRESEIYGSEDEFQTEKKNPYRGLPDEDMLALSVYEDIKCLNDQENILLVKNRETGIYYVKKLLTDYDKSIYLYLKKYPIACMPKIAKLYESSNCLIVIEQYVAGQTVAQLINHQPLSEETAIHIARGVCEVLQQLHKLPNPIIHRDVKPSNIIVTQKGAVYLLDMNVAKWYKPDKTDDTHYMGTQYYAAPEQVGYGFSASSAKSDIYAVGMLLNVMLTGTFPKEVRAAGKIWPIIERCISLEAQDRYTAEELIEALDEYTKGM